MEAPALSAEEIVRLDTIIKRLRGVKENLPETGTILGKEEVEWLVMKARVVFAFQPMMVEIEPPVAICGDTHGQFYDLLLLFEKGKPPPKTRYLFLGDYVDRGPNGVEVICLMLAFKIRYWNEFYMLRGNHETSAINRVYGFFDECKRKFGDNGETFRQFNDCFNYMPLAALVAGELLCMHGGISPGLEDLNAINQLPRPLVKIVGGIECDLLWADPDKTVSGFQKNTRGVSYVFGEDAVDKFCEKVGVQLIVRAHQVVQHGYEFFAQHRLLTVFSAPNYCNQFDNAAGLVMIDQNMGMRIKTFKSKSRTGSYKSTLSISASSST